MTGDQADNNMRHQAFEVFSSLKKFCFENFTPKWREHVKFVDREIDEYSDIDISFLMADFERLKNKTHVPELKQPSALRLGLESYKMQSAMGYTDDDPDLMGEEVCDSNTEIRIRCSASTHDHPNISLADIEKVSGKEFKRCPDKVSQEKEEICKTLEELDIINGSWKNGETDLFSQMTESSLDLINKSTVTSEKLNDCNTDSKFLADHLDGLSDDDFSSAKSYSDEIVTPILSLTEVMQKQISQNFFNY